MNAKRKLKYTRDDSLTALYFHTARQMHRISGTDYSQQKVMRILNEALGNVVRHAHANEVVVGLTSSNGLLSLRVEDDGNGFDMRSIPEEKMGLRLMKERANRVGGKLVVASVPGEGTSLVADIPLSA